MRKEYVEINSINTSVESIFFTPVVKHSDRQNRSRFSLNTFAKYLQKYEITWESKSKSRNRKSSYYLSKMKSEGRINAKKYPSIVNYEHVSSATPYNLDSLTSKSIDRNINLINMKHHSSCASSINTPHFATNRDHSSTPLMK